MTRDILSSAVLILLLLRAAVAADLVTSDRLALGLSGSGEIQGEIVELEADGDRFLAIFRAHQRGESRGGIVLLHDQGTSANSHELIRPLRLGLAEAAWDTLSLQLPSAHRGETTQAWHSRQVPIQARMRAGLAWLKARKLIRQVIIAQGDSGAMALRFAADKPPRELRALALVSASLESGGPSDAMTILGRLRMPVLDIYAERDLRPVLDTAAARKDAAAGGEGNRYTQRMVIGAMAGFFGLEDSLLSRIRGWLAANVNGGAAKSQ